MQFLANTKIDFMKYRKGFVALSVLLLIISIAELFALGGLNLGIDFAGGTQVAVRLRQATVDELRTALEATELEGLSLQRYGSVDDNEVLIKVPVVAGSEEGSGKEILAALDGALNGGPGAFDMNTKGSDALAAFLYERDPDGLVGDLQVEATDEARIAYGEIAASVLALRQQLGIFTDWNQIGEVDGVTPAAMTVLQADARIGGFSVLSNENVGPQIGKELTRKGILAVVFSLAAMLAYIWYRFELRFGIGAIVAVFHDFLIVLGLYALVNYEFNLPTIAAFLTLVGYSVNDTVVIFDRVRENMRDNRRVKLIDIMNMSLNQTLSRTVLTSGTTLLVVGSLFFLGGEAIRGFAFVLLIGVVIGTYSSIFVASPFALLWEKWFGYEAQQRRAKATA